MDKDRSRQPVNRNC